MAKITLNPLIQSASGRFGTIVLLNRLGTQCFRVYVKPRNPNTLSQQIKRHRFSDAVKSWQNLNPEEKEKYNKRTRHLNMSGYNLFISDYINKGKIIPLSLNTTKSVMNFAANQSIQNRFSSVSPSLQRRLTVASASNRAPNRFS